MVITHNLTAMNAQRQFNIVGTSKKKSTEKLSSGYKINRAADDAAGLTISEKMRSQIRALNQGVDNIQDGISLCNVADGALTEIHDMLHRENELIIKAANGTNAQDDLEAIQAEIDALDGEIDRIFETTEFNTMKIFKGGSISGTNVNEAKKLGFDDILWVEKGQTPAVSGYEKLSSASDLYKRIVGLTAPKEGTFSNIEGNINVAGIQSFIVIDNDSRLYEVDKGGWGGSDIPIEPYLTNSHVGSNYCDYTYNLPEGKEFKYRVEQSGNQYIFKFTITNKGSKENSGMDDLLVGSLNPLQWSDLFDVEYSYSGDAYPSVSSEYIQLYTNKSLKPGESDTVVITAGNIQLKKDPYIKVEKDAGNKYVDKDIIIQTNNVADSNKQIPIKLYNLSADGLSLKSGKDVSVYNTGMSLDNISNGIASISELRSYYGATTNRLEHSYRNNQNIAENTTAAESCIRDTDMATEMVNITMINILEQAVTSMMAQANQSTQGVLALLQ